MARQCNDCENPADVDMYTLRINIDPLGVNSTTNYHFVQPFCAIHAMKAHRNPRNKPRESFFLRETMAQEQVLRELLK